MRFLTGSGILVAMVAAGCGGAATPAAGDADPGSVPDGGVPDTEEAGTTSLSHCPTDPTEVRGPALVRVRWSDGIAFCIDSTEVTNAQYAEFVAAKPSVTTQSPRCSWNQTFAPETKSTNGPACPTFDPTGRADYPVVCVDWCDANAYCQWAGKHLCQKPGGGTVGAWTTKDASEWVIACTGDGAGKYPYGDAPVSGKCVDRQYPATTPGLRKVKEATMCEGGVAGLFDMSGNAGEWQDDCVEQSTDGTEDPCTPLGGSFSADPVMTACDIGAPFFRKQVSGDTGFRCCVDAQFF